jgi:hypothetical protein
MNDSSRILHVVPWESLCSVKEPLLLTQDPAFDCLSSVADIRKCLATLLPLFCSSINSCHSHTMVCFLQKTRLQWTALISLHLRIVSDVDQSAESSGSVARTAASASRGGLGPNLDLQTGCPDLKI